MSCGGFLLGCGGGVALLVWLMVRREGRWEKGVDEAAADILGLASTCHVQTISIFQ